MNRRRDPVGAEDDQLALGNLGLLLDEDRAALGQLLDDVLVVDDLLADVDRRSVQLERVLDGLHGAVDPGAVAARGGEQDALGSVDGGAGHGPKGTGGRPLRRDQRRGGGIRLGALGRSLGGSSPLA